jgi:hypothetical protein
MPVFTLLTIENIQNALRLAKFQKKMGRAVQKYNVAQKYTLKGENLFDGRNAFS